jgi:RNA polymerase subunit RPABC4/transcription elongation factor Spt4
MLCPRCGTAIDNSGRFCPTCGLDRPQDARAPRKPDVTRDSHSCPRCRTLIDAAARFCPACGRDMTVEKKPGIPGHPDRAT